MFDTLEGLDIPQRHALVKIIWLLSVIIVFQWVNLMHHWLVIGLKWWIYKVLKENTELNNKQAELIITGLMEQKDLVMVIKTWLELMRIQSSNQKEVLKHVESHAERLGEVAGAAQAVTVQELKKIPSATADAVLDKIHKTSESGVLKAVIPDEASKPKGEVM